VQLQGHLPQPLLVTTMLCSMRMQLPALRSLELTVPCPRGFLAVSEPVKALGGITQLKRLQINLSEPEVSSPDDRPSSQGGLCPAYCCTLHVTLVSAQHLLGCQHCLSDSTRQNTCW
jgi:hypothetical protein